MNRKCPHCNGSGLVEVTGVYAETFILLRSSATRVTGAELAKRAGCKATAMNNRLAMLEKFGLCSSVRWGRKRFYRVP